MAPARLTGDNVQTHGKIPRLVYRHRPRSPRVGRRARGIDEEENPGKRRQGNHAAHRDPAEDPDGMIELGCGDGSVFEAKHPFGDSRLPPSPDSLTLSELDILCSALLTIPLQAEKREKLYERARADPFLTRTLLAAGVGARSLAVEKAQPQTERPYGYPESAREAQSSEDVSASAHEYSERRSREAQTSRSPLASLPINEPRHETSSSRVDTKAREGRGGSGSGDAAAEFVQASTTSQVQDALERMSLAARQSGLPSPPALSSEIARRLAADSALRQLYVKNLQGMWKEVLERKREGSGDSHEEETSNGDARQRSPPRRSRAEESTSDGRRRR